MKTTDIQNSLFPRFFRVPFLIVWTLMVMLPTGRPVAAQAIESASRIQLNQTPLITFSADRAGATRMAPTDSLLPNTPLTPQPEAGKSGHVWLYVLGGMVIGGAAGAIAMGLHAEHCEDCFFKGAAVAAAAAGGALVGGLIGWGVYPGSHSSEALQPTGARPRRSEERIFPGQFIRTDP